MEDYLQVENEFVENLFQKKSDSKTYKEKQHIKEFINKLRNNLTQNWRDTSNKLKLLNKENPLREQKYDDISISKSNINEIIEKEIDFYDFEYNPNELIPQSIRNRWLKEIYS